MPAAPALLTPAAVVLAIAAAVTLRPHGDASPRSRSTVPVRARVDATSDAEARQLRHATVVLARELTAAGRCDPRRPPARFAACAAPALRHAGIGGRTTAMLVRVVIERVPAGACRAYLVGLQMANDAAGDEARWLLPILYVRGPRHHQRRLAGQVALGGRMLRRASRSAKPGVCGPSASGPAL